MKRSGVVHLAGALFVALYLLAGPAAAQIRVVPLPAKHGVQPCQQEVSKADAVTDPVNWLYCIDAVGGYVVFGRDSPGVTRVFQVTQTNPGVLAFSNSPSGPFNETLSVSITMDSTGVGQSAPFYVQGQNLGSSVFTICSATNGCIYQNSILVLTVSKVEFEMIESTLDNNPNAEGGLRIFPDKTFGADPADRRKVRVKATLSTPYPYAAMPVYFKAFDVDDPSANTKPLDANGSAGDDNRGVPKPGQLSAMTAAADPTGVAQVEFTVTMQPGDNFKIAASCDPARLEPVVVSGTSLAAGTQTLPSKYVQVTDMLTVWRRLHIEVDSMEPAQGNLAKGFVSTAKPNNKGQTDVTLTPLGASDAAALADRGRFSPGRIAIDGVGSYPVVLHSGSAVTVQGVITAEAVAGKSLSFELFDDDDFNDDDQDLSGDTGEDVWEPNLDLLKESDKPEENVFAPAYVRPSYDRLNNATTETPFVQNYSDEAVNNDAMLLWGYYKFDNQALYGRSDFWTVYLLGAYQGPVGDDKDGERTALYGVADGRYGGSVFLEVGRTRESPAPDNPSVSQAATSAHEIGHLFRNGNVKDGSLMTSPPRARKTTSFSDESLHNIRNTVYPGESQ